MKTDIVTRLEALTRCGGEQQLTVQQAPERAYDCALLNATNELQLAAHMLSGALGTPRERVAIDRILAAIGHKREA